MRNFGIGFGVILVIGVLALGMLRGGTVSSGQADARDPRLVAQGQLVYRQNCASCHGAALEGQPNWQDELPEGGRPAPPHDVTGHTWHHADALLFDIVKRGPQAMAIPDYVYRMPAFGGTLSDAEIWAVLAYIKSTWPPETQAAQEAVNRQAP